jgi:hypothetical protein
MRGGDRWGGEPWVVVEPPTQRGKPSRDVLRFARLHAHHLRMAKPWADQGSGDLGTVDAAGIWLVRRCCFRRPGVVGCGPFVCSIVKICDVSSLDATALLQPSIDAKDCATG